MLSAAAFVHLKGESLASNMLTIFNYVAYFILIAFLCKVTLIFSMKSHKQRFNDLRTIEHTYLFKIFT